MSVEAKDEASRRSPTSYLFSTSNAELISLLGKQLGAHQQAHPLDWQGHCLVSPRSLSGTSKVGSAAINNVAGKKFKLGDIMYFFTGDTEKYLASHKAEAVEVGTRCGNRECIAPQHQTLEGVSQLKERMACAKRIPTSKCLHDPACIRGCDIYAVAPPPAKPTKRKAIKRTGKPQQVLAESISQSLLKIAGAKRHLVKAQKAGEQMAEAVKGEDEDSSSSSDPHTALF